MTATPSGAGAERRSKAPFRAVLGSGLDGRIIAIRGPATSPTLKDEV